MEKELLIEKAKEGYTVCYMENCHRKRSFL